jgi:hypothetical protein
MSVKLLTTAAVFEKKKGDPRAAIRNINVA